MTPGREVRLDNGSTDGGFFTDHDTILPRGPIKGGAPDDVDEMKRAHEVRQELLAAQARQREREVQEAARVGLHHEHLFTAQPPADLGLDEFQSLVHRWMRAPMPSDVDPLTYLSLGVAGEGGEVANQVKKMLRDDAGTLTAERAENIVKELGDILFYAALLAKALQLPLSHVAALQIHKLKEEPLAGWEPPPD